MAMSEELRNGDSMADPRLARLYRETAREEPPAHLDAAILAAAHRDAGARPRPLGSAWLRSWRLPVSIAAVVVLSVSVVMLMVEEGGEQLTESPRNVSKAVPDQAADAPDQASNQALALSKPGQATPPASAPAAKPSGARETTRETRLAKNGAAKDVGKELASAPSPGALPRPFPATPPSTASSEMPAAEPMPAPRPDSAEPPATMRAPQMGSAAAPTRSEIAADVGASSRAAPASTLAEGAARADARAKPDDASPAGRLRSPPPESAQGSTSSTPGIRGFREPAPPAPSRRVAPQAAAPAPAARPVPAVQQSALVRDYEHQPPEKWIEKIGELRRDGKITEADEMLAEFKKRFPQHPLPATLR